jgi:hypothetical protein
MSEREDQRVSAGSARAGLCEQGMSYECGAVAILLITVSAGCGRTDDIILGGEACSTHFGHVWP